MTKKEIRQHVLKSMKQLEGHQKQQADQWLRQQLFNHPKYQQAQKIGIVLSMPHEVHTDPIILHIMQHGKQVYVPATTYYKKTMNFQQLVHLSQVSIDEKGIRYVDEETPIDNQLDLVIVPGVAFNREGYRIGYGGGYFDRFLSHYQPATLSLVYDIQIREDLPIASHDYPVAELIIAKT
ncbi:5-formyltetrahydrofolate cyclo-ligase [Staphylococcus sp. 17KM0847]|uniref:5-formyltetrahydrofolate cyclo-ligase n=1 Tax=Staphylococcus sp. 17KM0847 TaxID=2583989 RepID=UPI0015DCA023|nr:5-formyltetrahydrofolate cyclo-ligase [Staphylococcus sp. 17KM0847]QLK86069.1 5-formyltetrahydrofolate cyclo-ligase [Staphylococcus sp. 17KM0847]